MRTSAAFAGPLFRTVAVRLPRLGLYVGVPVVAFVGVVVAVISSG
jgi:hypothetical protein